MTSVRRLKLGVLCLCVLKTKGSGQIWPVRPANFFHPSAMDADALITKRLHISGLTPAITSVDLSRRLATFGTVKDLDGLGKLDALGEPKKFGYVTLEGTKAQLARCTSSISITCSQC